jgi:dihydrofolate reductase
MRAHFADHAVSTSVEADNRHRRRTDMGKLVVSENISLDGVIQDPRGEEGLGRGGWFARIADTDRAQWGEVLLAEALAAEALLLGRRSYEYFAARYPVRSGACADRLNSMPKYVVSATLDNPDVWTNSTVLKGDVVNGVAALKNKVNGEIVVYASGRLMPMVIGHAADDLPVRGRGRPAPVRRDQQHETRAPRRRPHRR